ncbi:MAG: ferritin [Candidatus Sumerlaeia bacterium]
MLNETMEKALNEQIQAETYSAYLYKSMEAYYLDQDLPGFANWMHQQTFEEMLHADIFFRFIDERGGRIKLLPIDEPGHDWDSPLAAFEASLEHEKYISGRINDLMNLAIKEGDHASNAMLQWFVKEQVEEEASVKTIVQKLKLVKSEGAGLFMIDQELAARVFAMPTSMPV